MTKMTAEHFKYNREMLGLTQTEMGSELGGYKLRTVQSWEAGERGTPQGVQKLLKLMANQKVLLSVADDLIFACKSGEAQRKFSVGKAIIQIEGVTGKKYEG